MGGGQKWILAMQSSKSLILTSCFILQGRNWISEIFSGKFKLTLLARAKLEARTPPGQIPASPLPWAIMLFHGKVTLLSIFYDHIDPNAFLDIFIHCLKWSYISSLNIFLLFHKIYCSVLADRSQNLYFLGTLSPIPSEVSVSVQKVIYGPTDWQQWNLRYMEVWENFGA